MKPVAIVTGARGLIGNYLVRTAPRWAPEWQVQGWTRRDLDLADEGAVRRLWRSVGPQLVIHCAALSRTGICEQDPALARTLNVEVTRRLADLSEDTPFIFFSSDQVFDGARGWYQETDPVHPLNIYAQTKVEAEQLVLKNPRHTVVRTSINAGSSPTGDRSFVEELRRVWQNGQTPTLFADEFRCPIHATVTAHAVWELAARNKPGLYHVAGAERLSRWEIGQFLATCWPELHPKMVPGSCRDFQGPRRPPDLSLRCDKLQALLSFQLPSFSEWHLSHQDDRCDDE